MTHVLIIDDAPDIVELAGIGMEIAGWTFASASGSAEALQRLQEQKPDLILLDYQLGPESGLDVLPKLQAATSTPVVFLTAATNPEPFLAAGAAGVVQKPFDPMTLADTLQPWLG